MKYSSLPVYQQKQKILEALGQSNVIVVESPTGSGKTTQLPVILYEAGYQDRGIIGGTQPRRIAAMSVSDFIRKQLHTEYPESNLTADIVGYKMRFDDTTSQDTKIKIMTDGILLQEIKADPMLSKYSVIIVDEAHERSLNIDFILGLLKRILEERSEFKVIISSATLNTAVFSQYFGACPVIKIDTKIYPVDVRYVPLPEDNEERLLDSIEKIITGSVEEKNGGDFLVFLTGERIIKECVSRLYSSRVRSSLMILPLYGRLTREEQEQVFIDTPEGRHKVIVATNIAETSITIDGIDTVIDSGLAKVNYYNPRTFTSSLVETSISQASCKQRKGRAGRTKPGTCYRLYSKEDFTHRPEYTTEEIYRTDLSEVVLRMAELGISDYESFDFISKPGIEGIRGAVETLFMLDALNRDHSLTDIGKNMLYFPLLPRHSRILVEGMMRYPDVLDELLIGTSFITANSPYLLPAGQEMEARAAHHTFRDKYGDFISYLKLYNAFLHAKNKEEFCKRYYLDERTMHEIVNIKKQLEEIVIEQGVFPGKGGPSKNYLCGLAKGLVQFVCFATKNEGYRSLTAKRILIHPGSVMFRARPEIIVAAEIVKTSRTFARSVSSLRKEWLHEISPILLSSLTGKSRTNKSERDTTWEIRIADIPFKLRPYKGKKKIAVLPWSTFSKAAQKTLKRSTDEYFPGNIRGVIILDKYEIMPGEKLGSLVKIAAVIDIPGLIETNWKSRRNMNSDKGLSILIKEINRSVLHLASIKKNKGSLGFLSLQTDGIGNYWFKVMKSFFPACEHSLASLETLIDEVIENGMQNKAEDLNPIYRRISGYLEL